MALQLDGPKRSDKADTASRTPSFKRKKGLMKAGVTQMSGHLFPPVNVASLSQIPLDNGGLDEIFIPVPECFSVCSFPETLMNSSAMFHLKKKKEFFCNFS